MMHRYVQTAVCLFAALPLLSQTKEALAAFDVASVKPCDPTDQVPTMMQEKSGTLFYRHVVLTAVIRRAYGVDGQQISGPDWINQDCYDFEAKFPPDTLLPQMREMLRNLLSERFRFQAHVENENCRRSTWWWPRATSRCTPRRADSSATDSRAPLRVAV
jgi:uncharacterized protein (TIGR03435 family)